MAQLPGGPFDPSQHESTDSFDALPAGTYKVLVKDTDVKPTAAQDGHYIQVTLEVLEGPYKGRLIWDRLNTDNPNPEAREISVKRFTSLLNAAKSGPITDTSVLHGKIVTAKVKFKAASARYEASNDVKAYSDAVVQQAPQQQPQTQPQAQESENPNPDGFANPFAK